MKILKTKKGYQSLLDPITGDISLRANTTGDTDSHGYYEATVTGENNSEYRQRTVRGNINHKREVCLYLKPLHCGLEPDVYDIDRLKEKDYDGILRDHASALMRENPSIKEKNAEQRRKAYKVLRKKRKALEVMRHEDYENHIRAQAYEPSLIEEELQQAFIELNALNKMLLEDPNIIELQTQIKLIQGLVRPNLFLNQSQIIKAAVENTYKKE